MKEEPKQTFKRDSLMKVEEEMQQFWEKERLHEANAPSNEELMSYGPQGVKQKYMVSFPYPYMNGRLHLGHSFSLSKCEFAARYQRLRGKEVLFPFGFHCTGMPIKACADKIKREIELYGNPPQFPRDAQNVGVDVEVADGVQQLSVDKDSGSTGAGGAKKKSKVAAKASDKKYQWEIMASMGVPEDEIHLFADPVHWFYYFPPLAQEDLKRLGVHVDWRRSFITTDVNPYYDSFVRWQFNRLKQLDKIKFGKRYTIYSPLDGQACADHDRTVGEGVAPQEYTLIKLQVLKNEQSAANKYFYDKIAGASASDSKVYLAAATLRPETMYGQTNCFVGPDLQYGAYRVKKGEVFICTERAAINLAYQGWTAADKGGQVEKLCDFSGSDLVGLQVKAPLSSFEHVYVLPMESVLATKGTGVVTSVPSDSPDDFATLQDLKKKADYYKIKPEWVNGYDPIPIIETPQFGNLAAVKVVEQMKINSPKDRKLLDEAKEQVYKQGFYSGKMIVGDCAGQAVQEAKPKIRQQLIDQELACSYHEPESLVISRSGDECVVCHMDQWYLNYGEEEWKNAAMECLKSMNTYQEETRSGFAKTLDWLREWACSRSFGLGTRLPWDDKWLIESLSDSTIYMAYYTVAHLLQSGSLDGSKPGLLNIKAEQMTDEVWNYIFTEEKMMPDTEIPFDDLQRMKQEFEYFYPLDLRVSGKDLISNHLTFFIYNHVAMFPQRFWPKAVRANGHLLIDNEKMSKSTGNFLTLTDAVSKYSADAIRICLASAGDGIEDANFDQTQCNAFILKLFNLKEWMTEVLEESRSGKLVPESEPVEHFDDKAFLNDINNVIGVTEKWYEQMCFAEVVKFGFHELHKEKDRYVKACDLTGRKMHSSVIKRYIEVQLKLMSPIIPHFTEYVWMKLMHQPQSIMKASWPETNPVDHSIGASKEYVDNIIRDLRLQIISEMNPKKKKDLAPKFPPTKAQILVNDQYPEWQNITVKVLQRVLSSSSGSQDLDLLSVMRAQPEIKPLMKEKRLIPFIKCMKDEFDQFQAQNQSKQFDFERNLPYNQFKVLEENAVYLKKSLDLDEIEFKLVGDITPFDTAEERLIQQSTPGSPSFKLIYDKK
ncbi:hypothetical protein MP228_007753 [Amoeboaphelidium protococcarum]|nr:hypothetical protein MP228_007753 [Amoeboaphelidium protococcarum]